MTTLAPGARVCDRERPDEAPIAIVIEHLTGSIGQVEVGGTGKTVAAFNAGYDRDQDTVVAMFPTRLDELLGDRWRGWDTDTFAAELEVYYYEFMATDEGYAYPINRLMYCGEPGVELDEAREHALRNIENLQLGRSA